MSQTPNLTIGLDVGDQHSVTCAVDGQGRLVRRGHVRTTAAALQQHLSTVRPAASCWRWARTRRGSAGCSLR
jgi:hypothetical protein